MTRCAKKVIPAGLAIGLLALAVSAQTATPFVGMPLYFEANRGQAEHSAQFLARGRDSQFLISPTEAQIVLHKEAAGPETVRMQFVGANPQAQIRGDAELPGKVNYLVGNDPAQWHTGVPTFAKVRVEEIYPGMGLVYYGNAQQLEYDFKVAPGADPGAIKIRFDGPDKLAVNAQGELILTLSGGEIRQPKPVIYQMANGARREISGGYRLVDAHSVVFVVGNYDHSLPLVIDPILSYSTYFGGNYGETAWAVAINTNDGSIYMAGQTLSTQFTNWTVPPGAFQTNYHGGTQAGDAFVAKFDNAGQNLIYFTYLGGSGDDAAYGLAVDAAGDAYIAGATDSTNFPIRNGIYSNISGSLNTQLGLYPADAFVAELDPGGSNLVYSTYLGGESADAAYGVAVDLAGNAYVTGFTYSTNFPVTNALQSHLACTNTVYFNANAFVAKIGAGGSPLVYSTYLGGLNFDEGEGIAVDSAGSAYVTGFTASTNFPVTNAIYQMINSNLVNGYLLNGSNIQVSVSDAFVARFGPAGTNLIYSTFLGGANNDFARHIAVDAAGNAYVTGATVSTNFPNTVTNIPYLHNGVTNNLNSFAPTVTNAFLTQITYNGTNANIGYSTVFGGTNACIDVGYGLALDPAGNVFVVGSTSSTNFPTFNIPGLLPSTNSGKSDVFVIVFNTNATALLYSTYLGGNDNDFGYGIAVDTNDNAYVVGTTSSTNFPTVNARQTMRNGTNDAFLAKIMFTVPPPEIATNGQPISQTNSVGSTVTFFIQGTANDVWPPYFFQWQFNGTNLVNGGNISGATQLTLTISPARLTDSGNYSLIVSNYGGSVTSSNAFLSITNVPPAITVQPADEMVGVGSVATLSVIASGTPPLSYQWQFNGSPLTNGVQNGGQISGATNATLTITNVQLASTGTYLVIVTNIVGSVTSSNAVLTVVSLPEITVQPTNQAMAVASTAALSVTAVGQVPLRYHWQFNGTNLVNGGRISGATNATLTISNVQTTNSGIYTVIITNLVGSITSSNAVLLVTNIPPAITLQPVSQTNGVGTTVTFSINGTGTQPFFFQWQKNGTNLVNGGRISGATNFTLTITSVQTNDAGSYSIIVTNPGGSVTSSNAILTVISSPIITVQPATNQSMAVGGTAAFSVTAIGQVPLSYHWQFNGSNLVNGGRIIGATTSMLTVTNAQTTNSGIYSVTVTNIAGSVTSSNAVLLVTNIPPAITLQPTNQTVTVTSNVTFVVTATGTVPLNYQWQFNGTNLTNGGNISGATTNVLKISPAQLTNSGNYTVVVTNAGGAVTSSVAMLTVASSPVITLQPTNQTMAVGATATFVITAVGIVPLSYQWQVNGTNLANGGNISGATANTLTISNAQTTNSGTYTVIVTNVAGSVTSSNAVLTVTNIPPAIIVQPTNQIVTVTSNVTFVVTATGTAPLSYQWQLDGTNLVDGGQINGAISNLLTITSAQPTNSGTYTVTVTNNGGSVISSNAILTVATSPVIVLQPTNQAILVGATATFVVAAVGIVPLSYQWQVDGTNLADGGQISGSISNVLTITSAQTTNSGIYTVIVTNIAGSVTSSNAVLTVTNFIPPAITVQPTNQTVGVGSDVIFAVTATGTAPLSYQWQMDGTNLVDGGQISGSISNVLTIMSVQPTNSGIYSVIVTNIAGSVTSSNAVLTVASLSFVNIVSAGGGSFILSGVGGTNNGTYYVLTATNLTLPLTNWTRITTNQFDNLGGFTFTNAAQTNAPQLFYILEQP